MSAFVIYDFLKPSDSLVKLYFIMLYDLKKKFRSLTIPANRRSNFESDFTVPQGRIDFDDIIKLLESKKGFAGAKLAHGFWEGCSRIFDDFKEAGVLENLSLKDWETFYPNYNDPCPLDMFLELLDILGNASKTPSYKIFTSMFGWRNGGNVEGTPYVGQEKVSRTMERIVDPEVEQSDALVFKEAVYNQEFIKLIEIVRHYDVIVLGPSYLRHFGAFARIKNFTHIQVDARRAGAEADKILSVVRDKIAKAGGRYVVCLIQAGGKPSSWLSYHLHKYFPDNVFLPMGQTLNLCNISKLEDVNWFKMYRRETCRCIEQINPEWVMRDEAYTPESSYFKYAPEQRWKYVVNGYEPHALSLIEDKYDPEPTDKPLDFIENKDVDFDLVNQILSVSRKRNHWANFGPVSHLLENYIAHLIGLEECKRVVMCKSGTEALLTMVSLANFKKGRRLKWVVSAFGFISSYIGELADSIILDCDEKGLLSYEQLEKMPVDSWDGVILTNTFGGGTDFSNFVDYCQEYGKELIVDNATALFTTNRVNNPFPDIVSFHQTKPWGQGEGGCAILPAEDEHIFRSLLNFGIGLDSSAAPYGRNGKISDFSCALIYQRLARLPEWERGYVLQARKITKAVRDCGLELLPNTNNGNITAHLPVLFEHPVSADEIVNPLCTLKKYYRPPDSKFSRANDIFSRIVNIPCHPTMASVSEEELRSLLNKISKGN